MRRRRARERRRAQHAAETPEQREARRAKKREYDRLYYLDFREEKLSKVAAYREINAMEISDRLRARTTKEKKEERRAKQRAAYAANPEKVRARKSAWKVANSDYHRQADRDRYMLNPEKRKAHFATWYARNRERIIAKRRALAPSPDL